MSTLNARIMKITGMFGGLQVTNIACSIVRAKLVALWIGTAGIGLFGILNSALEMIFALSQLGIRQSAVADIASARPSQLPKLGCTVRRWSIILGIAGALFTLLCSGWLSRLSFGHSGYAPAFAWLSITVLLSAVNNGEGAIFQGLQQFRKLAVCSMLGAVGGLAVSVPMFYFWGIDSIVPSIIAYTVVTWVALGVYRQRIPRPEEPVSLKQTFEIGRRFLTLGLYMTVTAVVTNAISYAFMAYLNHVDDLGATGCYNAGFTIINRYAGLVFTAISMEYFPRLAAVAHSRRRTSAFVINQLWLSLTVIVPVATLFIAVSPWVVRLLYSNDFSVILPFVIWAMPGTVLRAISWCMSFVILARSDGRTFLLPELLSGVISIALNILGYHYMGFTGLGYAYFGWYAAYTLIVAIPYFRSYRLHLSRNIALFMLYCLAMSAAAAWIALTVAPLAAIPFAAVASAISIVMLRRRLKA